MNQTRQYNVPRSIRKTTKIVSKKESERKEKPLENQSQNTPQPSENKTSPIKNVPKSKSVGIYDSEKSPFEQMNT